MQEAGELLGKVAMVTGAGRGIGRAIAQALGDKGAKVVVVARTLSEIEETAGLLAEKGQQALALPADVSDPCAVEEVVKRSLEGFGGIHILVNAAGIQGPIGSVCENDISDWIRTIEINLCGVFICCRAVLPHMIQQRYGKIINLSGGGATTARPFFSAYAASKVGVVRLTETLAEEVKEFNIQINAISPGAVNTRMLDEMLKAGARVGQENYVALREQLENGGTPPELGAALVAFLATDRSKNLTGKLIAALHDDWQTWDEERLDDLMDSAWFTLRRLDLFAIKPVLQRLKEEKI